MTTLTTPRNMIKRDRWGRPLVTPPDGGKPVPYTRATTLASTLEDTYNLSRWQQRMVAIGLADRPDLLLAVTAHRNDRDELNKLCEQALEAAKGTAAATTGTALHALTEQLDRGEELPTVPPDAEADLAAYTEAMRGIDILEVERFVVLDDIKVAGTYDRLVDIGGIRTVADIKTGTIEWGLPKIAMQLAIYSRGVPYNPNDGTRSEPLNVDQRNGLIIHLPAGSGTCTLHWVDLHRGWEAVKLALQVREWRNARNLTQQKGAQFVHNPPERMND